jgi:hypothetical protein
MAGAARPVKRLVRAVRGMLGPRPQAVTVAPDRLQQWAIGMYGGPSPLELSPLAECRSPVLTREDVTDVPADFVADPFLVRAESCWYLFFEVWNRRSGRGEIAVATSPDCIRWSYGQIVLRESFHLSYPHVFAWEGQYYMIPETAEDRSVRLYRALAFPTRWTLQAVLLTGTYFLDSTPFQVGDWWWMFAGTVGPERRRQSYGLRLFGAAAPDGPWKEHPDSPLRDGDPHLSRPGGRVVRWNGRHIRFTQDCYPVYGTRVSAVEIIRLDPAGFAERVIPGPVLGPSGSGWNADGMHHVDVCRGPNGRWLAVVDGFHWVDRDRGDGAR